MTQHEVLPPEIDVGSETRLGTGTGTGSLQYNWGQMLDVKWLPVAIDLLL